MPEETKAGGVKSPENSTENSAGSRPETKPENKMVLHRKWRSQGFEELVGQEHVIRTLKNALASGRIASAYLFCGPRGTGKTSTARILAKAIDCPKTRDGHPCNTCRVCRSISAGSFLDVIEMDAASHTQVDKIREFIVEKVNFRPVEAPKKIYIIDEVHKLSSNSFDALLKTIEEPPPFVVFILATTDPEKLPPTIVSRCQRFDFKRISVRQIMDRLKEVSTAENFCIEDGALNLIAQAADGALRDALVILEQAVSFSQDCITADDVVSLLGMTRSDALFSFADTVLQRDVRRGLEFISEIYRDGKDLQRFTVDLLEHFRRLLLINIVRDAESILEVSGDAYSRLREQAQQFKVPHLMHIIKELMELRKSLKEIGMEQILWEMEAIKLTRWELSPSIDSLSRRIADLEARISGGAVEIQGEPPRQLPQRQPERPFTPPPPPPRPQPKPQEPVKQATFAPPQPPPPSESSTPEPPVAKPVLPPIPRDEDEEDERVSVHDELGHAYPEKEKKVKTDVNDSSIWHRLLREVAKDKQMLIPILKDIGGGTLKRDEYTMKVDQDQTFSKNLLDMNKRYLEDTLSRIVGSKVRLKVQSFKGEKLFGDDEKPHNLFVQEVSDMFSARPVDK